jgi:hypothetical protein
MKFKYWLQLFRAQTAPATILLILVPYLTNASLFSLEALAVGLFALLAHWVSFGHNSLMDTAMGYDRKDPSKSHHPLVAGRISMAAAHNVIHWSLSGLAVVAILISLALSPNPTLAIISIFLWFVFGYAYNSGLSKECLLSFLPISICFAAMGAWGWFLSHSTLDRLGWLLLAYFFMTILFQISWSGHLKELELKERSNLLVKMDTKVEDGRFTPGYGMVYGSVIKFVNVPVLGALLLVENFEITRLVWFSAMIVLVARYLFKLVRPRQYVRSRELRNMSAMEILTIYAPIPLVLPWVESAILMLFGVIYFLVVNRLLWGVASYPRV